MALIGICATKGSGKDTCANHLINKYNFIKYSFADPLKRGLSEMFGMSERQLWGDLKEEIDPNWGISPRELLQIIGTELMQYDIHQHTNKLNHIGRNIWVHRFKLWYESQIKQYQKQVLEWNKSYEIINFSNDGNIDNKNFNKYEKPIEPNIVIADVRFPHEANIIKELGGYIIKLKRPSLDQTDLHASETELESIESDFTLINDNTIESLWSKIDDMYLNMVVDTELKHYNF